jgi:uncharacterized protein (DUF1800 family)
MPSSDLALMAHLMRRAGFGADRDELERLLTRSYDSVVDDLVHPENVPGIDEDILDRYYYGENVNIWVGKWMYRMVNNPRQLQEKMALFWHHVFATGLVKNQHVLASTDQIEMFRRVGMTDMRTLLTALSKDPAMIFWLDNNENHKGEPNENYGRELLELFSMGVGNYTEDDIKNASRAFTGWTFEQPIPLYPHGYYPAPFVFREDDHDDEEKTFLGETGRFNGEDIIDIVVRQPATARFIARHLYNFFVADEPQVPSWNTVPPQDPAAVEALANVYLVSGGQIRPVLETLFKSDFFKQSLYKKVKSPTELVMGIVKLVGTYRKPEPNIMKYASVTTLMGQQLCDPPTVEGWHTGREWIDGGALNERVNFAVNEVGDVSKPGVVKIIERVKESDVSAPTALVERCLELTGPVQVGDDTRRALMRYAEATQGEPEEDRVRGMLQLIVSTREYQFA